MRHPPNYRRSADCFVISSSSQLPFPSLGTLSSRTMNATGSSRVNQPSTKRVRSSRDPPSLSWFSLPTPMRAVFDTFPLVTYEANKLPQRNALSRQQNTLHIHTIIDSDDSANLSLNPGCLKWQAYLLSRRVPFKVVSSNNHASPSGALPFVLPSVKSKNEPQPGPVVASKIARWCEEMTGRATQSYTMDRPYLSLVEQNIREAWLYALYLNKSNFEQVAQTLYVDSASTNSFIRAKSAYDLRAAAKDQLLRTRTNIDEEEIYEAADAAFKALSTKLGDGKFFSDSDSPDEFDVSLFAYTYPLVAMGRGRGGVGPFWSDESLLDLLLHHESLVKHREAVLEYCLGAT